MGLTPDSVQYLRAASALIDGEGLSQFSSHWPPGYPVSLAAAALATRDVLATASWLHAGIAAASIALLALLARMSGWRLATVAAFLLIGLHPGFLHVHFLLWSEPLFLAMVLASLLMLPRLILGPSTKMTLTALIVASASAVLVRYAGTFLILVNALVLLAFARRFPIGRRVLITTAVSMASLLPLAAWAAFNRWRGMAPLNRSLSWHPPDMEHAASLQSAVANWFGLPEVLGLPAFATLLAIAAWTLVQARSRDRDGLLIPSIAATFVLGYAVFLLISISLVDHHTPVDERLLFPIFPLVWLLIFHATLSLRGRTIRFLSMALLCVMLVRGGLHGVLDWDLTRENGLGLSRKQIRDMPVLDWMRTLPPQLPIVSNGPELCTIYLKRDSVMLPPAYNPTSLRPNPQAMEELSAVSRGPTLIVHFQVMSYRTYLPGVGELERLAGMQLVYRGPDAMAWVRNAHEPLP